MTAAIGRRMAAAAALAVLALPLLGCKEQPDLSRARCLPPPLQVEPSVVSPGQVVTVSSRAAGCDLGYAPDRMYNVSLLRAGTGLAPESVAVNQDGSFSTSVLVANTFPSGDATIVVKGSPYDDCADSTFGSCAGYTATISVR
ncbi:hypothetical protein [Leifsonia sp. 2MCAF36]|uniref:hypothetical protein n=1 Tax=Leifsonia sp. 2MCAF36 TaxID=3232988 RepID=UPI003F96956A